MECLIHLLALCVFDPSGVYIRPSIDYALNNSRSTYIGHGMTAYEGAWCNNHWCRGPMGSLEIGHSTEIGHGLTLSYRVKHVSFIEETDRGYESFGLDLVWRPFHN